MASVGMPKASSTMESKMAAPPPVVPQPLPAADPASPTMEDVGGKGHGFWRPIMIGNRMRTTSEDSADAFDAFPAPGSMLDDAEQSHRDRKLSLSEMFLGHHGGQGERRRSSADSVGDQDTEGKPITDNPRFREFLRRQRQCFDDQA